MINEPDLLSLFCMDDDNAPKVEDTSPKDGEVGSCCGERKGKKKRDLGAAFQKTQWRQGLLSI